jgi:hypothetical protein
MYMLTQDIEDYRKSYYKKNQQYLLEYSKWYYSYRKYLDGKCDYDDVRDKPNRNDFNKNKDGKPEGHFSIQKGEFILKF